MPSMTSLAAGPGQKRQRRLKFQSHSDEDDTSEGYSSDSQSLSQKEDSHPGSTNPSLRQQFSAALSTQRSGHGVDAENNDQASSHVGTQSSAVLTRHQAMATRQAAAPSSLPAVAAAMGSTISETSRSAATRAATAAAVTPLAARRMSSASGKTAPHSRAFCILQDMLYCLLVVLVEMKSSVLLPE